MQLQTIQDIYQAVFHILDKTAARGSAPRDAQDRLAICLNEWKAQFGGDAGQRAILSVIGTIGVINSSGENDPMRQRALLGIAQLKQELRVAMEPQGKQ